MELPILAIQPYPIQIGAAPEDNVNVFFKKDLKNDELIEEISQLSKPQLIFWYMGEHGFREEGVKYYQKKLGKILQLKNEAICSLYDLTAWAALRKPDRTFKDFNQNVEQINQFAIPRLQALKSSDFFQWLGEEKNSSIAAYIKDIILKRPFIFKVSQEFPETGIKIGELFFKHCPILEPEYERDTGKAYSAFQYIEGCYLINRILEDALKEETEKINIAFVLPNDEWKYYENAENSFAQDVTYLVKAKFGELASKKQINIYFYTFPFGKHSYSRPYNSGSKNIELVTQEQLI